MKSFIATMLLLCVSFSYTHAGDEGTTNEKKQSTKMEDREVIYHDFDLELELEDGVVEAEWDEFEIDGFDWYKLVYSISNTNPVYPIDNNAFIGSQDQTEAEFRLKKGSSKHYIRLCAVVLNDDYSKDRYCGNTQTITGEYVDEYAEKKDYKKEENEKQEKKYTAKNVKEEVKNTSAKKVGLSINVRQRVNQLLEGFLEGLDVRGFTDIQKVEAIDTVLDRLYKQKESNPKHATILEYIEKKLLEYREDFDSGLEEIEGLFQDF